MALRSQVLSEADWVGPMARKERVVGGWMLGRGRRTKKGVGGQVVRVVVLWGWVRERERDRERGGGV